MPNQSQKFMEVLKDDDASLQDKKRAAKFFLQECLNQEDIAPAIPLLKELYHECNQVDVMALAGDAIVLFFLQRGNIPEIEAFVDRDTCRSFSLESIKRAAERGADIAPLIPVLMKYSSEENYSSYHAIEAYLKQEPGAFSSKLAAVSNQIIQEGKHLEFLAFIVQEGAINKLDMTGAMPRLVQLINHESTRIQERAVSAMEWAVGDVTDFMQITDELEKAIKKTSDHQDGITYCLTYHYVKVKAFEKIDHFTHSSQKKVRKGAYHAINAHLIKGGKNSARVLQCAIEGLRDVDEEIRTDVFNGLKRAERNHVAMIPGREWFSSLPASLNAPGINKQLLDFVYMVAAKNHELANSFLNEINNQPFAEGTTGRQLLGILGGLVGGEHSAVCSICRYIPRDSNYGHELDLPNERNKLGLLEPSLGSHASLHECPECGALYWYEYEQEYDDMSLDTSISLRRLDPREALGKLDGEKRKEYEKSLESLLNEYRKDLDHPVEFARSEASWMLARYFLKVGNWEEVIKLLRHRDEIVRDTAINQVATLMRDGMPLNDIKPFLDAAMVSGSPHAKQDATWIITRDVIARKDHGALQKLLQTDDAIILNTVTHATWIAVREEHFNIEPLIETLFPLTRSKNGTARSNTLHAIEESNLKGNAKGKQPKKNGNGGSFLTLLIGNLADENVEVRNDAARSLERMANKGTNLPGVVPALVTLLATPETTYNALSALKAAQQKGNDISQAIPILVKALESTAAGYHENIAELLYQMKKAGVDVSNAYAIIGRLMIKDKGNIKAIGTNIFELAIKNGENISCIEQELETIIGKGDKDYYSEFFIKAYTYINVQKKNWEGVIKLLEHHNKNVPGPAATQLAAMHEDMEPLVPALVRNLFHPYWFAREESALALKNYCASGLHATRIVEEALKGTQPGKNKKANEYKELLTSISIHAPGGKQEAVQTPEEIAIEEIEHKRSFLTNLGRVSSYRGSDETRYIFRDGDLLFDTWYNKKTKAITDLSWVAKGELQDIVHKGFFPSTVASFLKPFASIPAPVIQNSALIAAATRVLLEMIMDASSWYCLKSGYESAVKRYIHHQEKPGYHVISVDASGKLCRLEPCSREAAEREVCQSYRNDSSIKPERADPRIVDDANKAWSKLEDALKRLESGETCEDYRDEHLRRYFVFNGGIYFYMFADGGHVDTVSPRSRDAVIQAFLDKICDSRGQPTFVVLNEPLKSEIALKTEIQQYFQHVKNGEMTIGGGPTTDMQWSIEFKDGKFVRRQGDGHGGTDSVALTEDEVKEILTKHRYGWTRFRA